MVIRVVPSTQPRAVEPDSDPDRVSARIREFVRTTPARLTVLGVGLVVVAIVSGTVAAVQVADRQQTLDALHSEVEPLAYAAQDLYSALSVADAAAATAFISGGVEPTAVRDRYTTAISEASADLVDASAGIEQSDAVSHDLLTQLSVGVPVYTGLVETARTNNRDEHPVGSAYLSEASNLMQSTLLPLAERLHSVQAARVVRTQAEFATPPWPAIVLLVVTLVSLVVAQVLLARGTRRRLNAGLIVASLAVAASLGWLVTAGVVSAAATSRALDEGARPLSDLTAGRILAQQARSDETLGLVRRDFTGSFDAQFRHHVDDLGEALGALAEDGGHAVADQIASARHALDGWSTAHVRLMTMLSRGDWTGATEVAIGPGNDGAAAEYAQADSSLSTAIEETRTELRGGIERAVTTLTGLSAGTLVLAAVAVAGIAAGVWPRLREYQ
ncbi:protein kinase G-activating protein GlnX [Rhodococcus olei]|uniref:Protein kinase G-activating protein GlnX n=1 Tax=Rhodococcus olei TaxID=2161675 RepID=A0ABP8PHS3_9NOCA